MEARGKTVPVQTWVVRHLEIHAPGLVGVTKLESLTVVADAIKDAKVSLFLGSASLSACADPFDSAPSPPCRPRDPRQVQGEGDPPSLHQRRQLRSSTGLLQARGLEEDRHVDQARQRSRRGYQGWTQDCTPICVQGWTKPPLRTLTTSLAHSSSASLTWTKLLATLTVITLLGPLSEPPPCTPTSSAHSSSASTSALFSTHEGFGLEGSNQGTRQCAPPSPT